MEFCQLTALEQQMFEDLVWAGSAPEVQRPEYYGKYVVVRNKRVLGVGTDHDTLVQAIAAQEQVPWQELVVTVVPDPEMWEIPH